MNFSCLSKRKKREEEHNTIQHTGVHVNQIQGTIVCVFFNQIQIRRKKQNKKRTSKANQQNVQNLIIVSRVRNKQTHE